MPFRADIHGLRAIALLAVVIFHFNASLMPGGFAGVDVFFVISGFLMTGIILKGIDQNKFSLSKFYVSRAKRIVPALAWLCFAMLVFGWFFTLDHFYARIAKHILSSMSFISNFTYWGEASYFDASSYEKWLLNTWSLSAEWQFYMVYPLILLALSQCMSISGMKKTLLLGTIIGFLFCVVMTYKWPTASYYLLPTRAWEMLVGGLAFLYPWSLSRARAKRLEVMGLALILCAYLFVSKQHPWPGYLALLPVIGTFFVIQSQRVHSVLTNNIIFQKLGTWSYSIYLWHWPLVVYMHLYMKPSAAVVVIFFVLSIVLGALCHIFLERKLTIKQLCLLCILVYSGSAIVYLNDGNFEIRAQSKDVRNTIVNRYKHYVMDPTGLFRACNASLQMLDTGVPNVSEKCLSGQTGGLFLWGDSHVGALSTGIRQVIGNDMPFSQLTSSGCEPSFASRRDGYNRFDVGCDFSNELVVDALLKTKPKIVILGMASKHEAFDWDDLIDQLYDLGVSKVVVIGPFPQWRPSLPVIYVRRHLGQEYIADTTFDKSIIASNQFLIDLHQRKQNFVFVDMLEKLCKPSKHHELQCRAKVDDTLLVFDYGHLTVEASRYIAKNFVVPIF